MSEIQETSVLPLNLNELSQQVAKALRLAEPSAPRYLWPLTQVSELQKILQSCTDSLQAQGLLALKPNEADLLFLIETLIEERKFFPRHLLSNVVLYAEDVQLLEESLLTGTLMSLRGQSRLKRFHELGMVPGFETFSASERLIPKPDCTDWWELGEGAPPPVFELHAYQRFAQLPQRPVQFRSVCPLNSDVVCDVPEGKSFFWDGSLRDGL